MNEKDSFSNVQRLNSTIMAKYEWTSSRIGMQKSGEEVHDRRMKTYRKANEFLQELLQKRSDGSSLDDNGTLDRYHKFLKYKTNFNNDDSILDEFDRRLRALNGNKRRNQTSKTYKPNDNESITIGLQTTSEIENNTNELIQHFNAQERSNSSTMTSSLNTINPSILSKLSFDESQINISLNTNEHQSLSSSTSLEQSLTSSSSLNHSIIKILYKPIAQRADGSEIKISSTENSLQYTTSNVLPFNHCYFPRSLLSREQNNTNKITKRQLPSHPIEQYDKNQLFHLLDHLDNECSSVDFTTMLDQLTLSSVQIQNIDNNISLINDDDEYDDKENILIKTNLFDESSSLSDYYTISTFNIDDPRKLTLYTMTTGTVQLKPSCLIPYSILNGRRPLLQCSIETNFKQIRSKRQKHICQVTAIESLIDMKYLKENDIILKINNQSVYHLNIDDIRDILQQQYKTSNYCLLTIARLCQPLI
ncbi:unnamed protein product [Rotaria sp. Silwood1]|nr:unnamed protein product [Rotaria sp. Silwood1]CAF0972033.1 unnamed protein product [Rotaria sp. Silwood1]CAF0981261.1 unnamed protein product [Rotaria sp. Silwood1]CAF3383131.1 unnamed protein product [Rotaria sp. Silwood1]CAF3410115.1 unnamed protein product [Rotaria sp. Silwood1]